uniref:Uncharacterized protein n=1 Tax=Anguilla anguilla TaxID=7936 RepID=A0A0E9PHI8_ANGAN
MCLWTCVCGLCVSKHMHLRACVCGLMCLSVCIWELMCLWI